MLEISFLKQRGSHFFDGETFQRLRMAHAVPGAIICSNYDISIICANCYLFNWHQPEDLTSVRKCTGCRVVARQGPHLTSKSQMGERRG